METDNKKRLMEALGVDEKTLMEMLRKVSPQQTRTAGKKAEHGPIRLFKHVTKSCTCIHCGTQSRFSYNLSYGDSLIWQNKEGRVKQYVVRPTDSMEDITVDAFFPRCESCLRFVSTLSRTELETRYMYLLGEMENVFKLTFKEVKEERGYGFEDLFPNVEDDLRRTYPTEAEKVRKVGEDVFDLDLLY